MLTVYLIVLGVGLVALVIGLILDAKNAKASNSLPLAHDVASEELVSAPVLDPSPQEKSSAKVKKGFSFPLFGKKKEAPRVASESSVSSELKPKEELKDIKQALVDKLDQKCIKLEQILEEKNQILAQLQKDIEDERAHRGEFEALKAILQQQIDDLKAQNRNLKDELERMLQENLRLQTGMVMSPEASRPAEPPVIADKKESPEQPKTRESDYVRAEPDDVIPGPSPKISLGSPPSDQAQKGSAGGLTLRDVFGEDDKSKETSS